MYRRSLLLWVICLGLTAGLLIVCGYDDDEPTTTSMISPATTTSAQLSVPTELSEEGGAAMSFMLTSSAFANGEAIPRQFSCDGKDVSPPLEWRNVPQGTRSFSLICDDPDAPRGTWVHWMLYNLSADRLSLPENASAALPESALHGKNSWGRSDYGGPCPPSGTHRYFFKLYALDTMLDLKAGASKDQLLHAMGGHILAQAELMGVYKR